MERAMSAKEIVIKGLTLVLYTANIVSQVNRSDWFSPFAPHHHLLTNINLTASCVAD
jgi:hypothetical protein